MAGKRTFRFPDSEWWAGRSANRKVLDYRIEMRPEDALEYGTDAESVVRRIVERVVNGFDPIAVWLFGSMARGDCNEHSDVDLMVIMPEGTDCKTAELGIMGDLRGSMLPKEVLVDTPDSFARAADDVGSIQHSVREDGVMLYG